MLILINNKKAIPYKVQNESSSLKIRLIAVFILFCILPMSIISVYSYSTIKKQVLSTAVANLEAIAKIKSSQIESFYKNVSLDISNITENDASFLIIQSESNNAKNDKTIQTKNVLQNQLEKFIERKGINEIHILTLDAKPVISSFGDSFEYGASSLQTAFYKGKEGTFFSDVYESIYSNKKFAFAVGQPIRDKEKKIIGVAVAEVVADSYYELINDYVGLGETGETLLAQKIGDKTLFLNPLRYDQKAGLVKSIDHADRLAAPAIAAANKKIGSGIAIDYRGKQVLAAWRYIPFTGFGIVSKIDLTEVLEPLFIAKITMLGMAFFISIFGVIFSLYLAEKILKPVASLERRAKRDPLTGLLNRSSLEEALQTAILSAKRNGCMAAVLLVDLDGFKMVNDTKGHEAGDLFLKKVATLLTGSIRMGDFTIRLGGDEFVIIMEGVKNIENVKRSANTILSSIRSLSLREFGDMSVSASIGIALFPLYEHSPKKLLKMADEAMYEAKRAGKNRYKFAIHAKMGSPRDS